MTTDLLDDLVRSLLNDPLPDQAAPDWAAVLRLATPPSRRRATSFRALLAAAAAAAIILVPTAVAFHRQIADLIQGKPAPPSVARFFEGWNAMQADAHGHATAAHLFAGRGSQLDVGKAEGVAELETPGATVSLWEAPQLRGGECWLFVVAKGERAAPRTTGSCDLQPGSSTPLANVQWLETEDLRNMVIVHARVYDGVADVDLEFADGTTQRMTVAEGHAVAAVASDSVPTAVVAKDSRGNVLQTVPVHLPSFASGCPGTCTGGSSGSDFNFGWVGWSHK